MAEYYRCDVMDNVDNIFELFPKKNFKISEILVPKEDLLAYWKERNKLISDDFHKSSVFQKQETLDVVLAINNDLYELVLKLKEKMQ